MRCTAPHNMLWEKFSALWALSAFTERNSQRTQEYTLSKTLKELEDVLRVCTYRICIEHTPACSEYSPEYTIVYSEYAQSMLWHTLVLSYAEWSSENSKYIVCLSVLRGCSEYTQNFINCIRTHQEYIQGLFRECFSVCKVSQSMLCVCSELLQ